MQDQQAVVALVAGTIAPIVTELAKRFRWGEAFATSINGLVALVVALVAWYLCGADGEQLVGWILAGGAGGQVGGTAYNLTKRIQGRAERWGSVLAESSPKRHERERCRQWVHAVSKGSNLVNPPGMPMSHAAKIGFNAGSPGGVQTESSCPISPSVSSWGVSGEEIGHCSRTTASVRLVPSWVAGPAVALPPLIRLSPAVSAGQIFTACASSVTAVRGPLFAFAFIAA